MSHHYRDEESERRDRRRERSRDRPRRTTIYDDDNGEEDHEEPGVFAWVPAAGIDFDVITEDLPLYMGTNSTVERAKNPKDGRTPGYYVRGPYTLTVPMLADLKRDTIDWEEERARTGNRDYRRSETRNRRRGTGPKRKLATPQAAATNLPQRTDSIPIPGRHERRDDTNASFVDASPRIPGQFPPQRTSSRPQVQFQGGYDESSRSADIYSRHETSGTTAQSQGRGPSINPSFSSSTNTQQTSQPRNPAVSAPPSGNQSTFTREDMAKHIARKLREEGRTTVSQEEFDRAVDDAFRRLQNPQAPPPYTKMPTTQPSTTEAPGFSRTATAGPMPDSGYNPYRY